MNGVKNTTLEIYQYPNGSTKVMRRVEGTSQTYERVIPDDNVWLVAPGLALTTSNPVVKQQEAAE